MSRDPLPLNNESTVCSEQLSSCKKFFLKCFWSHLRSPVLETSIIWDNSPDSRHNNNWPISAASTHSNLLLLAKKRRQSRHHLPFLLPPLFIFNSEVVYFFMIATSVCSQCQLPPSATLCSIIPVLTPKSPWHHSTGCCSNFTGTRHKGTGARYHIIWFINLDHLHQWFCCCYSKPSELFHVLVK